MSVRIIISSASAYIWLSFIDLGSIDIPPNVLLAINLTHRTVITQLLLHDGVFLRYAQRMISYVYIKSVTFTSGSNSRPVAYVRVPICVNIRTYFISVDVPLYYVT